MLIIIKNKRLKKQKILIKYDYQVNLCTTFITENTFRTNINVMTIKTKYTALVKAVQTSTNCCYILELPIVIFPTVIHAK